MQAEQDPVPLFRGISARSLNPLQFHSSPETLTHGEVYLTGSLQGAFKHDTVEAYGSGTGSRLFLFWFRLDLDFLIPNVVNLVWPQ